MGIEQRPPWSDGALMGRIVDASFIGMWIVDRDDRVIFWSPRMAAITGVPAERALGTHPLRDMLPSSIEGEGRFADVYLRARQSLRPQQLRSVGMGFRDGKRVHCSGEIIPLVDEKGEYFGTAGTVIDVSREADARRELAESEERYRTVFQNASDGVLVHGVDDSGQPTRFVEVNDAACEMLGYERRELLALGPMDVDVRSKRGEPPVSDVTRSQEVLLMRTLGLRKDGSTFPIELHSRRLSLDGRPHVITVARDLSCAVRVAELERTGDAAERFMSSVSHELRTPLNSIIGFTGVLLQGLAGEVNDEQQRQLGFVYSAAQRLRMLVEDVLALSRMEPGRVDEPIEVFPLSEIVAEAVVFGRRWTDEHGLLFVVSEDSGDARLCGNRARVLQALLDLLDNAVKFTSSGTVTLLSSHDDETATLTVEDTGIGLVPDDLVRVLAGFCQVGPERGGKTPGIGLGLVLCDRVARGMGGRLTAESRPGQGSSFSLVLPLARVGDGCPASGSGG